MLYIVRQKWAWLFKDVYKGLRSSHFARGVTKSYTRPLVIETMPTYKLHYFNGRGRAELTRLIFAQAGIPYEDIRIELKQWPELKPTMPFGQVPVLEVGGTRIAHSSVIARYLAEEFGMAGSNLLENSQVAGIAAAANDMFEDLVKARIEKDEGRKAQMQKDYREKAVPFALAKFEALSSTNKNGYLWGDKLTWADLAFFNWISIIASRAPAILDKFPSLKKLKETVETLPNIARWLKERPESEF